MLAVMGRGIDQNLIHAGATRRYPRREDAASLAGFVFHTKDMMRQQELNPPAIVKIAMTLEEELAQKIKAREEKAVEATLEHARLQGIDLLRAQHSLGKRKFAPWLRANFRFRRQTAYKYMRIARHWEVICQQRLQMISLEGVARKLFGKGKAKKPNEQPSAPEANSPTPEATNVRPNDEDTRTGTAPGEQDEAGAEVDGVVAPEPEEDEAKPELEVQEEQQHDSEESDHAAKESEPALRPRKKRRRRKPREEKEARPKSPTDEDVIRREWQSCIQTIHHMLLLDPSTLPAGETKDQVARFQRALEGPILHLQDMAAMIKAVDGLLNRAREVRRQLIVKKKGAARATRFRECDVVDYFGVF